jgi:hypothetical protein
MSGAAAAVVAVMSGCGTTGQGAPAPSGGPNGTPATAWQRALDAVGDDGTFSKDAALTLFAIAFGGMPGVAPPPGPTGRIRSGTIALRAVLAHESELTDAQRARVAEVRSLPDDSAGAPIVLSFGRTGHVTALPAHAPTPAVGDGQHKLIEAKARQLRQDIKARLGADIPGKLTLVFDSRDVMNPATGAATAGMADATFTGGKYTGCFLHLYPATFAPDSNAVTTTAHEMIHCFQAAMYPDEATYVAAPQWALEGSAEWGSATLVGPDKLEDDLWPLYLNHPGTPLFRRAYDTIGFYAHLDETGHSPWAAFRTMWSVKGNAAQFAAVGGTNADFLDSWASSVSRKSGFGTAWDTTGPGITGKDSAPKPPLAVGKGAPVKVAAKPYTEQVYTVEADTDLLDVSIAGHARLADGSIDETSLGSRTFCLRPDQCACPDGTSPENAMALAPTGALLALTGGPDGTAGTVQGRDLDCGAPAGKGASWHFEAPSRYSGGRSHTIVDAYTCASLRGPWQAKLHVTHDPATPSDPPLDRMVPFTWSFDRDGRAVPTVGPYKDTVFGRTHTITYYPLLHLDEAAGTITVVSLQGSEDGSTRVDVTNQLDRIGEAVPVTAGKPRDC